MGGQYTRRAPPVYASGHAALELEEVVEFREDEKKTQLLIGTAQAHREPPLRRPALISISAPSPALSTCRVPLMSMIRRPAPSGSCSNSSAAARRKSVRDSSPSCSGAARTFAVGRVDMSISFTGGSSGDCRSLLRLQCHPAKLRALNHLSKGA